jgi:hypothetical protein
MIPRPVKSFASTFTAAFSTSLPLCLLLAALLLLPACSRKPPEEMFLDNIGKMMLIDRELGFKEEISSITVQEIIEHPEQTEVIIRVEGWATHPEISIGAVLPAATEKFSSWATWKFYCVQTGDDRWEIKEKYKVAEGFVN